MKITLQRLTIFASLLVAALPAARAEGVAGGKRPASVPASYVVTPFGYFHPSCVVHLAKGDELRRDEKVIRHADGTSTAMQVCGYARYKADGSSLFGDERGIDHPDVNGYVELVSVTTDKSYGSLSAQWTVPVAPAANDGQTIFIFPGLEDITHVVTILQPVLGWNSDYDSAWGIASWNCCESGTTYEAVPARTESGDTIYGKMIETCPKGTKSCATWNIVAQDLRTGKSSELADTSSFGQTFNWAFAGALEVYGVVQCSDFPTTDAYDGGNTISMNSLILSNKGLAQVTHPDWKVSKTTPGLNPDCHYGASIQKQIILNN